MSRERMGNADAAWLHMDRPTNLMIVNSVWLFDEPVAFERLEEVYASRLIAPYPRFRQRVEHSSVPMQGPSWVDDPNFDVARHLHHIGLPAPGNIAALQDVVGDLMATPLDPSKPLWDVYLIDGVGAGCAVLIRMHHCIADGIALARVMLTLTDAGSQEQQNAGPGFSDEVSHGGVLADALSLGTGLVHEGVDAILHPRRSANELGRDAQTLAKLVFGPSDGESAVRGELSGMRRVAWSEPIPLQQIKSIAHAQGATVNDILLAAVSGALRRYMLERDGVAELHAIVPFNLRPLDEPIPRTLGNRFGLVFLALPVELEDPRERVRELKRRMDEIKDSPEGPMVYMILGAVGLTPVPIEKLAVDFFSSKGTAVMTNVPGPREPVYLAGVPVRAVLVWAPTSGSVGMSVSIFSYRGAVTIGVMVDAALVPVPQEIIDALGPELAELESLGDETKGRPAAHGRQVQTHD